MSIEAQNSATPKIFFSLKEIITATGYSRSSILRMCAEGLPHIQAQKWSHLKFRIPDVERWMLEKFGRGDQANKPKKRGPGRPRKYQTSTGEEVNR